MHRLRATTFIALVAGALGVGPTLHAQEPPKVNEPTRPGVARPAEIPKDGVLQVEVGVDSRHDGDELDSEQTLPTLLRYSVTDRIAVDFGFDGFTSQVATDVPVRATGFGDSTVGTQWVALTQTRSRPALALAYVAKLPTGTNGLGTGKVDHRATFLVSKKLREVDVNGAATYLNVGEEQGGRTNGGSFAVSASQEFTTKFGYVADLSHQTVDAEVPKGTFLLGAVTYKLSDAAQLDAGVRAGLASGAARFSVLGGLSVGIPLAAR